MGEYVNQHLKGRLASSVKSRGHFPVHFRGLWANLAVPWICFVYVIYLFVVFILHPCLVCLFACTEQQETLYTAVDSSMLNYLKYHACIFTYELLVFRQILNAQNQSYCQKHLCICLNTTYKQFFFFLST